MIYDFIIIGAGSAGLFAGASFQKPLNGLILNKGKMPGQKILMAGGGKCNVTHGGSIKDFVSNYGKNGNKIRTVLYRFSNQAVEDFFENHDILMKEREDGKVFPASLCAQDVREVLIEGCIKNGFQIKNQIPVTGIWHDENSNIYTVLCGGDSYLSKKLLVATGGCSYPGTGSDGLFFPVLKEMGFAIIEPKPALVPIYAENYPYKDLAGISFSGAEVSIYGADRKLAQTKGDVLLAHHCFSGPAILDISQHAQKGREIQINYFPQKTAESIVKQLELFFKGNSKTILSGLLAYFNSQTTEASPALPKRFLENLCLRCGIDSGMKASRVAVNQIKDVVRLLTADTHKISRLGDYRLAMATAGGVSLDEVHAKSLESKKYPGLYLAGEVLDVVGKTGGYNLQFAFSSGHLVATEVENALCIK